MERFEPNAHWDAVVVVGHASTSEMPRYDLDLHLGSDLAFEDVGEMTQLICTTAHKLV